MSISYIICAAGEGKRFGHLGLNTTKPFLKIKNQYFFEFSLRSLPITPQDQLIVVNRFNKIEKQVFKETTQNKFGVECHFIDLKETTRGQAETALAAQSSLQNKNAVIFNIDTYFKCSNLREKLLDNKNSGYVPCARMPGESWSFFKTKHGTLESPVIEVAEKVQISEWASVGFYHFTNIDSLFDQIKKSLKSSCDKEMYVSTFYNSLIAEGAQFAVLECETSQPFGTLDQLQKFCGISESEFLSYNRM